MTASCWVPPIYAGRWLKSAKDLVERTSSRMHGIPVWLFSTGPIGDPLRPEGLPADVASMLEQSGVDSIILAR